MLWLHQGLCIKAWACMLLLADVKADAAQVVMVWDNVPSAGPGPYGLGLASALGETQWLPNIKGPVVFR